jgi:hypothetical protein
MSDKPQVNTAFIPTNSSNPFSVKCPLFSIKLTAILNKRKSACFLVIKGYRLKWLIIIFKSLMELTRNCTESFPCLCILPTPHVICNASNKLKSFICKEIRNIGFTAQPVDVLLSAYIDKVKQPSASTKPVIY